MTFVALVPKILCMEHTRDLPEQTTEQRTLSYELCSILMRMESARSEIRASGGPDCDRLSGLMQAAAMIVAEVTMQVTPKTWRSPEELEDERLAILDRADLGDVVDG